MKTSGLLIALLLGMQLGYATSGTDKALVQKYSRQVRTSLIMPEAFKQQSGTHSLSIWFVVNAEGEVTDVTANTDQKEVRADLEKQFRQLNFKGLSPGVCNSIDVSFVSY